MSSNSNNEDSEPAEDDVATAGMELTVQGVQIRPFKFFSGQGELMGHVWSGTASDRTTAFQVYLILCILKIYMDLSNNMKIPIFIFLQALILLHDHAEWITLGNGITAELKLLGTASFDLAGEIQLSIWSRVAHSVVEKK